MQENKLKIKLSVKVFETIIIWLMSFNFLIGALVFFKSFSIFSKMKQNLNLSSAFVDLVKNLVKEENDLKALQKLVEIYRIFILLSVIVIAIFLIIRLARREYKKLAKYIYMVMLGSIIFSCFLIYLTKDIFYAIKSINERIYTQDISKILYLLQKMQNIKDTRYIIIVTFVISLFLSLLAIATYLYEMFQKTDEVYNPKLNITFCIVTFVIFIGLAFARYRVMILANNIDPSEYYILSYDIDDNNKIIPVSYVNYKKIEEKYLDPHLITFLEKGLAFDIDKKDKTIETNKEMKVSVSYNVEVANELNLNIKKLNFYVENKEKPELLQNLKDLDKKSIYKLMKKYDTKYINENIKEQDEISGIYSAKDKKNNIEIYVISKIEGDRIPLKLKADFNITKDKAYQVIYLGNIFVNSKHKAIAYTGMNNDNAVVYIENKEVVKQIIEHNSLIKY